MSNCSLLLNPNSRYYSNGQVSSIHETFQPDGGIQYYDVTDYYNADGSFLRKEDNSLDTRHTYIIKSPNAPQPVQKEAAVQQKDSVSFFIKNTSQHTLLVYVSRTGGHTFEIYQIRKQKSMFIGAYCPVKNEQNPEKYFTLKYKFKKKGLKADFITFWDKAEGNKSISTLFVVEK